MVEAPFEDIGRRPSQSNLNNNTKTREQVNYVSYNSDYSFVAVGTNRGFSVS